MRLLLHPEGGSTGESTQDNRLLVLRARVEKIESHIKDFDIIIGNTDESYQQKDQDPFVTCLIGLRQKYSELLSSIGIVNCFSFYYFARNILMVLDCGVSYTQDNFTDQRVFFGREGSYNTSLHQIRFRLFRDVEYPDETYFVDESDDLKTHNRGKRKSISLNISSVSASLRQVDQSFYFKSLFHSFLSSLQLEKPTEIPIALVSEFISIWRYVDTTYDSTDFLTRLHKITIFPEETDIVDNGKIDTNCNIQPGYPRPVKTNRVVLEFK